jgi:glutamate-1-semialdehyde 2,1-aminomutase
MEKNRSEALYDAACRVIPGGVNSPVRAFKKVGGAPVYFASATGSRVVDADGREYVDFCQSWGPLILGHSHPAVIGAVTEAAPRGLSYGACHAAEIELAELVLDAFPEFERVRAVSSGTEAVMTALRLARGATGRDMVVKFDGGYHGHFDGMLVKAGSGLATFAIADSGGVAEGIAATTLVADLDDEESVRSLFERHGDRIAAVIIEPMPANNGLLVQRTEFLQFLRQVTADNGALLIFDEVISGFRLKFGGYGQIVGVQPDLVTLGKIIGGGMPIGAVVGPASIMDLLSPLGPVYQAGTLSGNPVSLAAGIATLKILRDDGPYERLEALGAAFEEELAAGGLPGVRAVRQGSIVWPYFSEGEFPRSAGTIDMATVERFNTIYRKLLDRGCYLPPSAMEVCFLSAAHTEDEVRGLARAIVEELKGA